MLTDRIEFTPRPLHGTPTYAVKLHKLTYGEENFIYKKFSHNGDFRNSS